MVMTDFYLQLWWVNSVTITVRQMVIKWHIQQKSLGKANRSDLNYDNTATLEVMKHNVGF